MASGNIVQRKLKNGKICYTIAVDGGCNPITGERIRVYKTAKTEKEAKSLMHKLVCDIEKEGVTNKPIHNIAGGR
jgi:hypothetical protein